jgi:hypothetical protein
LRRWVTRVFRESNRRTHLATMGRTTWFGLPGISRRCIVVTKDGKQVTDLKPNDFELCENGRPQTITCLVGTCYRSSSKTAWPKRSSARQRSGLILKWSSRLGGSTHISKGVEPLKRYSKSIMPCPQISSASRRREYSDFQLTIPRARLSPASGDNRCPLPCGSRQICSAPCSACAD